MSEINSNKIKSVLLNLFKGNTDKINAGLPDAVNKHRDAAIQNFDTLGIPAKGEEDYKYSDLMRAFGKTYGYSFKPSAGTLEKHTVFQCSVANLDTYTLIVENGWFYNDVDELAKLPEGVTVMSFNDAANKYPELFEKYYNKSADNSKNPTTALNTAFAQSGLFIHIADNVVLEKPIQIINILQGNNPMLVNQRNLIIAGKNSQAKIVICDHTLSYKNFLLNLVNEVVVEKNAVFDIYGIQNQHNTSSQIVSTYINQKQNSNTLTNTLTLHGGFVRNNTYIILSEENSEANVYGLSLIDGTQHVDSYTFIDHAVPNCTSNELFKNVVDDEATGAFSGKILVRPDAQKTYALQSNKNICLTDKAKFFTKPQLEIYADDVKCSHGATVGQIDEDALFYLQSRGIGGREARMMLMYAFAYEVISKIRIPVLVESYGDLVEKRLRGEETRCDNCAVHCNT